MELHVKADFFLYLDDLEVFINTNQVLLQLYQKNENFFDERISGLASIFTASICL